MCQDPPILLWACHPQVTLALGWGPTVTLLAPEKVTVVRSPRLLGSQPDGMMAQKYVRWGEAGKGTQKAHQTCLWGWRQILEALRVGFKACKFFVLPAGWLQACMSTMAPLLYIYLPCLQLLLQFLLLHLF